MIRDPEPREQEALVRVLALLRGLAERKPATVSGWLAVHGASWGDVQRAIGYLFVATTEGK